MFLNYHYLLNIYGIDIKMQSKTITVSEYLDRLNNALEREQAKIIGEISEVKFHQNGHVYFSLLDSHDQSRIECVIWRSTYRMFNIDLSDGLQVVISVTPNIWKPKGRLSFIANTIELVGEGALQKAYEKLKKKLEAEGLFNLARKREIPIYPRRIGVITSKSGAVINDFLSNIGKFGFEILFVDSRVEGSEAIKDLLSAVETLRHKEIDVLVIMRGGGSLESFLAFNNETLIRTVADFPAPTLTGIGHDKDVPLLSLVSDKNVSTPTAVANLLNQSWNQVLAEIRIAEEKILSYMDINLIRAEETLDLSLRDILRGFEIMVKNISDFLKQSEKSIELSSPTKRLSQGYSIVRRKDKVLRSVKETSKDDKLEITVSDGVINSIIV